MTDNAVMRKCLFPLRDCFGVGGQRIFLFFIADKYPAFRASHNAGLQFAARADLATSQSKDAENRQEMNRATHNYSTTCTVNSIEPCPDPQNTAQWPTKSPVL